MDKVARFSVTALGLHDMPDEAKTRPHHVLDKTGATIRFRNPHPSFVDVLGMNGTLGLIKAFGAFIRYGLSGKMSSPDTTPPTVAVRKPTFLPSRAAGQTQGATAPTPLRATWLGHACYYVEFPSGLRVLFDPVFEDRCSPMSFMGPQRFTPAPCTLADLPAVDAVVISHSHYDHLSGPSVQTIQKHHPKAHFFVGLGLAKWFTSSGIANVTELDWWQSAEATITLQDNASTSLQARFDCLPSQHTSARTPFDQGHTLWCSWAVSSGGRSVYFGGDTGYRSVDVDQEDIEKSVGSAPGVKVDPALVAAADDAVRSKRPGCPDFAHIGRLRGPFDVGLLPIGAYSPRALFSGMHADPLDAVDIFRDTKCRRALGIHWGTWVLTTEPVLEPPAKLREALRRRGIPETEWQLHDTMSAGIRDGSGSESALIDDAVSPKRQRLFIARQACELCRQKRSRCDGGSPCGTCAAANVACQYAQRKATKSEVSLGMIFNALQRIEKKIDHGPAAREPQGDADEGTSGQRKRRFFDPVNSPQEAPNRPHSTNASISGESELSRQPYVRSQHIPVIQYPIRQLPTWPAIREVLQQTYFRNVDDGYDAAAATVLERRRAPLPLPAVPFAEKGDWLAQLSVTAVKELCDAYFSTFNLGNPILDRRLFSQHSLGVAINTAFGYNIESCVVLVTMALGVLGSRAQRALASLPFGVDGLQLDESQEEWENGVSFFNAARQRAGLLDCDTGFQACQYHLLSGLFYSQLVRPVDWWSTVAKASACCTGFWACVPRDCSEWTMDMQARLFWITAMFEALVTQELDVPVSNLLTYEDRVPLPRFVEFPGIPSVDPQGSFAVPSSHLPSTRELALEAEQDAFCHYHFLSQIAHRIILTRLCDSLFAQRHQAFALSQPISKALEATTLTQSDYPPQALEDELLHQLEQWRAKLPPCLQWQDGEDVQRDDWEGPFPVTAVPDGGTNPSTQVFVVPWLQARYLIARYHLRRPLLHRALHHSDWMTPEDFRKCRDALACAVQWTSVIRPSLAVPDCLPLTFFICTQMFGFLLLFYTLDASTIPELRALVPAEYHTSWRVFVLHFLEKNARASPSIAREYEIISSLFRG